MPDKHEPVVPAPGDIEAARARHCIQARSDAGIAYERYANDHGSVPRGTVLLRERVMPAYPRTGRIYALERGIAAHFPGEFWAEEKIDGYNVRITAVNGVLVPFTRSGIVSPFTMDRLPDLLDADAALALFREHPDLVLCAEVAGPNNPYIDVVPPRVAEDIALFAFDFLRLDNSRYLPLGERDELLARYHIPIAPVIGRFTMADVEALKEVMRRLDREGGEGLVLKSPAMRLKYVTPVTTMDALRADAALEMELPGEYFIHRIARMAIGLRELDLRDHDQDLAMQIGEALLQGFERALDEFERTGEVAKTFSIKVRDPTTADRVLERINRNARTVRVREIDRRQEGIYTRVVFVKRFMRSTSILGGILDGHAVFD